MQPTPDKKNTRNPKRLREPKILKNMVTQLNSIIEEILGLGDRNRWRISKVLCLMGTINHLVYVAASEAEAVTRIFDKATGKDFLRLNASNRPKLLSKGSFRASLSGIASYLEDFWPYASKSRRTVRDCNDCLERWGFFKRHVFFERKAGAGADSEVNRFSLYANFDIVNLLRLFEALEGYLVHHLERGALSIGDRVLKKTKDLYEHGAMFVQSLFAFVGASNKPFGSGEAPTMVPGSPEAQEAQEDIALRSIIDADNNLAAVAEHTPANVDPLIDEDGNLLDEDCDYSDAEVIFKTLTKRIQHWWNVVSPERQPTALDELPHKFGNHSEWAWDRLIEEDPPGLY